MVFNRAMETKTIDPSDDWELIQAMGGPAAVARMLGFKLPRGIQRVQNWKTRGIPARILVDHAKVFKRRKRAQ